MTPIKKILNFLIHNRWQDNLLIVLSIVMVAQLSMTSRMYNSHDRSKRAMRAHKERVINHKAKAKKMEAKKKEAGNKESGKPSNANN